MIIQYRMTQKNKIGPQYTCICCGEFPSMEYFQTNFIPRERIRGWEVSESKVLTSEWYG